MQRTSHRQQLALDQVDALYATLVVALALVTLGGYGVIAAIA